MSKIQKMSISGIRSFDHRSAMSIEFKAPLTLIVGMNGSGKTTIIECLKFVTSGELPPNSDKGQSFIHDPKMAGQSEVLASIKLMFISLEKIQMVCTRNMSLTVKRDKPKFQQAEGSIRMLKGGEKNVISSRVGELNSMMPRFLGVSRAVLENVIFCHQEDSLWPMAPSNVLKLKFDQIFEAHKYTQAIENIKILQKNKKHELGELKQSEAHAKSDHEKAKKLKKQMTDLEDQCEQLRDEVKKFGEQVREAKRKYEEANNELGRVNLVVGELTGKRIERQTKEESVKILRENLREMSDSDEQLQIMLEQHDEQLQAHEEELESHKRRWREKDEDVKAARNKQSVKERECGAYEAQKDTHDRQVENRNRLIQETARAHNMRGYDMEVDEDTASHFMKEILKKAHDQQSEFERVRVEVQEEVQEEQKKLNHLNEEKSALKQGKESSRQQINTYDRKISSLQRQINDITADEGAKVALDACLRESRAKLLTAKSEAENSPWNAQIDECESEIRRLEDVRIKLDAEQAEAARRAGDSAQLDYLRKEVQDRQRSLDTMMNAHGDKITAILGSDWSPQNVEALYRRAVEQSGAMILEARNQHDGTSRELDGVTLKYKERCARQKSALAEVKAAEMAIRAAVDCKPQEYTERLSELEDERDKMKQASDSFQMLQKYLEQCIKDAKNKNACRLCCRSFAQPAQLETALNRLKEERAKWVGSGDDKESLAACEDELEQAKKAGPHFDNWERLTHKEIPEMQQDERKYDEERQRLIAKLEKEDALVREREDAKREIESNQRNVSTIEKYNSEIEKFTRQIEDLTAKQKAAGLSRGLEAIQADVKKTDGETKAYRATLVEATGNRDRKRNTINALELEVSNLSGQLSKAEYSLKEKKTLQDQEDEYKGYKSAEQGKLRTYESKLESNAKELAIAQTRFDDKMRRGADRDRQEQEKANKLNNSVNKLSTINQEIKAYHERGGDEQLHRARREQELAESEVARLTAEQQQIVRQIKKLEEQLQDYVATKRSIIDNQRYRRDLRQLQVVRGEIERLEERNAEDDARRFNREANLWQQQRNELAANQASVIGQLKGKDDELVNISKYYQTEYKDAKKRYKAAHVMVETTKAAIDDLGKYSGALDKAIMRYHTLKMEQINMVIAQLWRSTYQGSDVDTILIRSESETVESNKSYNYRVVMVKQDTEMDMRGRCSAGQKVLASIIIRLALADTFGHNCGMLALDEPTTNLDHDNIRALAESLGEIIKIRRAQDNFQLIVITHDEDFLQAMGSSDYTDNYWRVSRDERQNTVIEKQNIAEVM
jgi:DNA repair protein RAD50